MVQSVGDRKASRVARGGATQGLKTLLSSGRRTVHALDAMVKSALKDDPALLAGWRIAKRVELVTGTRPATPPAPASPVAPPVVADTVHPDAVHADAAPSTTQPTPHE
jgi:hypothetical protein